MTAGAVRDGDLYPAKDHARGFRKTARIHWLHLDYVSLRGRPGEEICGRLPDQVSGKRPQISRPEDGWSGDRQRGVHSTDAA
ncbi:MAG: hypothetical protein ACRDYX_19620 [Egibacteraceae bacterium]